MLPARDLGLATVAQSISGGEAVTPSIYVTMLATTGLQDKRRGMEGAVCHSSTEYFSYGIRCSFCGRKWNDRNFFT